MGITRSRLPYKYGNLPSPSYWGNLYGSFARLNIKNDTNLFSNDYPKSTIWVIYPFILNFGEFIYKVAFP